MLIAPIVSVERIRHVAIVILAGVVINVAMSMLAAPSIGVKGCIVWCATASLVFALFTIIFLVHEIHDAVSSVTPRDAFATAAIIAAVCAAVYLIESCDQFIYYWDIGSYWHSCFDVADSLASHPKMALISVYETINTRNYNLIGPFLMAVPVVAFGGSYAVFTTLIIALFAPPSILLAACTLRILQSKIGRHLMPLWFVAALYFGIGILNMSQIEGWIDGFACIPIFGCYALVAAMACDRRTWKHPAYLAVLLVIPPLFRRTFAFWTVGFAVGLAIYCALEIALSGNRRLCMRHCLFNYGLAGLLAVVFILLFMGGFVSHSLSTDYAFSYSAYDSGGGIPAKVIQFIDYIGLLWLLLIALSVVIIVFKREHRAFMCLLLTNACVAAVLFWRVQDMGYQHYLIVAPELFMLLAMGCSTVLRLINSWTSPRRNRMRLAGGVALCMLAFFSFTTYSGLIPYYPEAGRLLGASHHVVKIRHDLDELERLAGSFDNGDVVYVDSSSGAMCDSILTNSFGYFGLPTKCTVIASNIDLRDGFNYGFFKADKVVVCTPVQLHRRIEDQHVVSDLVSFLISEKDGGVGLANRFRIVDTFALDGEVTAYLLERTGDFSESEVRMLQEHFDEVYPQYPSLFHDRFESALKEMADD